jgi:hypothetical protein
MKATATPMLSRDLLTNKFSNPQSIVEACTQHCVDLPSFSDFVTLLRQPPHALDTLATNLLIVRCVDALHCPEENISWLRQEGVIPSLMKKYEKELTRPVRKVQFLVFSVLPALPSFYEKVLVDELIELVQTLPNEAIKVLMKHGCPREKKMCLFRAFDFSAHTARDYISFLLRGIRPEEMEAIALDVSNALSFDEATFSSNMLELFDHLVPVCSKNSREKLTSELRTALVCNTSPLTKELIIKRMKKLNFSSLK